MWQLLQLDEPGDYICATGKSHTVRYLCDYAFRQLGLDYKKYVVQDKKFLRPTELTDLKGSTEKLQHVIDLKLEYTFEKMIDEMIEYWIKRV